MMAVLTPLTTGLETMTDLARQKTVERQMEVFKSGQSREELKRVAQDFEAMFMAEMLQPMFEGVGKTDGMFGGGHGEAVFKTLMVQEYGKIMANRGGLGIAKQLEARYGGEGEHQPTVAVKSVADEVVPVTDESVTKLSGKLPRF
ncbi:MAG: rod-binding protein [Candidatus Pacebacteria bacterium]|nr:rod-binding protein [Candidatus Paceibacterota bacterium]